MHTDCFPPHLFAFVLLLKSHFERRDLTLKAFELFQYFERASSRCAPVTVSGLSVRVCVSVTGSSRKLRGET